MNMDTYRAACQRRDAAKAAGDRAAYAAAAAECGRIARELRAQGIDPLAPAPATAAAASAAIDAVIERQRRNDAAKPNLWSSTLEDHVRRDSTFLFEIARLIKAGKARVLQVRTREVYNVCFFGGDGVDTITESEIEITEPIELGEEVVVPSRAWVRGKWGGA